MNRFSSSCRKRGDCWRIAGWIWTSVRHAWKKPSWQKPKRRWDQISTVLLPLDQKPSEHSQTQTALSEVSQVLILFLFWSHVQSACEQIHLWHVGKLTSWLRCLSHVCQIHEGKVPNASLCTNSACKYYKQSFVLVFKNSNRCSGRLVSRQVDGCSVNTLRAADVSAMTGLSELKSSSVITGIL